LVFCLFLLLVAGQVAAGESHTIVLVSSAATLTAGYTESEPINPLDVAGYSNGAWVPASATTYSEPGYWYSSTTAPFGSGAVWISSQATTEGGYGNQWRLYKIDFDIPEGSTVTSAQLWYTADNAVTVYLNDEEIGSTGYVYGTSTDGGYIFNNAYTVNFTPKTGSNSLKFVVRNWPHIADNPTGLLYKGQIVS
jgi:hypothetical protein